MKALYTAFFVFVTLFALVPVSTAQESSGTQPATVTRGGQTIMTTVIDEAIAPDGRPMRAGSLIVKFGSRASEQQRANAHRGAGAFSVEPLLAADTVRVQLPRNAAVAAALNSYRSQPAVERVGPDYIVRAAFTPNDTRFGDEWGMTKIQAGAPASASATSAWDISRSSADTRVAILDCGIYHETTSTFVAPDGQTGHPDLRGRKLVESENFTTAPTADDFCNHGTHVAGTAAANTNNSLGVAGVGFNASLVNVKVLGDNGSGSFAWIINGILWAAGCNTNPCGPRRAEIINMSLGATGSCSADVQSAIDKAWEQGLVLAAAAGNSGANGAITPANCNKMIGVAASDQNDLKASFSNFGPSVDVAAPGVSILSTDYVGGYSSFNGTSMASPHTAGLAALLWTTPYNTSNQAIVDRIFCSANKSALAGSTHGRIDAYAAVSAGGCLPQLSINDASGNEGNSGTSSLTFTVTLSAASASPVSVSYATADGTATLGDNDYLATSGTLIFTAGETSKQIAVSVNGDISVEPNETFFVNLSSPSNATIADGQGVGTIINDDGAVLPTITIGNASRNEGNSGSRNLNFTVSLSAASAQTVTVAYATADDDTPYTAFGNSACGAGTDYLAKSGTLSIPAGVTSGTISVKVCGDRAKEPNETFFVNLSSPTNATIAGGKAVGTINNDD